MKRPAAIFVLPWDASVSVAAEESGAHVIQLLIVLFLVFVFPLWDRRETRYLKTTLDPDARLNGYRKTIGWQIVVVAILFGTQRSSLLFYAPGAAHGLIPLPGRLGIGIAFGLLAGALVPVIMSLAKPETRDAQVARLHSIAFFLPRTREERAWFAAMSVVVGVCEEIIFRAFLISWFLALSFVSGLGGNASVIVAAIAAAIVFGIDHGYQGWTGILATGALALMMTLVFFVTGSLLVPMLVHVLLDLRIVFLLPRPGLMPASRNLDSKR